MADLTREEFLTHIDYVRQDIRGVHVRLDALNGRTRTTETGLAVLGERIEHVQAEGCNKRIACDDCADGHPVKHKRVAGLSAGAAGVVMAVAEGIRWWVGK